MKTSILLLMLICFSMHDIRGQAKQRKELLLQIAALRVYIDYAQKGYTAVNKGLHFIGDVKKGEVHLHGDYFTSLKKVNPKIQKYSKVAEIIALQLQIVKTCKHTIEQIQNSDLFHGDEIKYIERSFERLIDNCIKTLDELLLITADYKIEMKDDQRLRRIDDLFQEMMRDYNFCKRFSNQADGLAVSRAQENRNIQSGRVLNGI